MATAAKNKIVRAYTVKDIESDNLECALINQLNKDIYSIDGWGGWVGWVAGWILSL